MCGYPNTNSNPNTNTNPNSNSTKRNWASVHVQPKRQSVEIRILKMWSPNFYEVTVLWSGF